MFGGGGLDASWSFAAVVTDALWPYAIDAVLPQVSQPRLPAGQNVVTSLQEALANSSLRFQRTRFCLGWYCLKLVWTDRLDCRWRYNISAVWKKTGLTASTFPPSRKKGRAP